MGILDKLSTFLFGDESYEEPQDYDMEPRAKAEAQPIEINPPPKASLERQLGRLRNLFAAYQLNPSEQLTVEIDRYRSGIAELGHRAPSNLDETDALINSLKG